MRESETRRIYAAAIVLAAAAGVLVPVGLILLSGTPFSATTNTALASPTASRPTGNGAPSAPSASVLESGEAATPEPSLKPTPDTQRPTITARTPGTGAVNVRGNSTIRITFSEPVRSVSSTTIKLINVPGGWLVRSTVRYDAAKRIATLSPNLWMYPKTQYRVTIASGVTDQAGNRLAPTSWTFTVGSR